MQISGIVYDLIVVGESDEGIELINTLIKASPDLKILLVSTNITKQKKLPEQVLTVEKTVIDVQYSYGAAVAIISAYEAYLCKNLVFAVGQLANKLAQAPLNSVYYNVKSIIADKKAIKTAVVYCNNANAINEAISISRKIGKVFICEPANDLAALVEKQITPRYDNICYLPMCKIKDYTYDNENKLNGIILDTLAELPCDALFVSIGRKPDTDNIKSKMVEIDQEGYIIVNDGLLPKVDNVYAIGKCTKYNNKNTEKTLESLKIKLVKETK